MMCLFACLSIFVVLFLLIVVFLFKQYTAYDMRISDWSSDVCSSDLFAFQIYPYIALAVFFIGSWVRFDKSMYTWRTGSSQLLSDKGMRVGSNLFHIGILAILAGHLVGLLTPHAVYEIFITAPQKQLLAMVVGGVFGLVCLVGIVILVARRLFNPRVRATGTVGDTVILLLLLVQLLLGLVSIYYSSHHMEDRKSTRLNSSH